MLIHRNRPAVEITLQLTQILVIHLAVAGDVAGNEIANGHRTVHNGESNVVEFLVVNVVGIVAQGQIRLARRSVILHAEGKQQHHTVGGVVRLERIHPVENKGIAFVRAVAHAGEILLLIGDQFQNLAVIEQVEFQGHDTAVALGANRHRKGLAGKRIHAIHHKGRRVLIQHLADSAADVAIGIVIVIVLMLAGGRDGLGVAMTAIGAGIGAYTGRAAGGGSGHGTLVAMCANGTLGTAEVAGIVAIVVVLVLAGGGDGLGVAITARGTGIGAYTIRAAGGGNSDGALVCVAEERTQIATDVTTLIAIVVILVSVGGRDFLGIGAATTAALVGAHAIGATGGGNRHGAVVPSVILDGNRLGLGGTTNRTSIRFHAAGGTGSLLGNRAGVPGVSLLLYVAAGATAGVITTVVFAPVAIGVGVSKSRLMRPNQIITTVAPGAQYANVIARLAYLDARIAYVDISGRGREVAAVIALRLGRCQNRLRSERGVEEGGQGCVNGTTIGITLPRTGGLHPTIGIHRLNSNVIRGEHTTDLVAVYAIVRRLVGVLQGIRLKRSGIARVDVVGNRSYIVVIATALFILLFQNIHNGFILIELVIVIVNVLLKNQFRSVLTMVKQPPRITIGVFKMQVCARRVARRAHHTDFLALANRLANTHRIGTHMCIQRSATAIVFDNHVSAKTAATKIGSRFYHTGFCS